jgi:hypothetical protein
MYPEHCYKDQEKMTNIIALTSMQIYVNYKPGLKPSHLGRDIKGDDLFINFGALSL